MNQAEIEQALGQALATLYEREAAIIERDGAERTIAARLARYLEDFFPNHAVHVEYNRHGVEPKEIELPGRDGLLTLARVFPDIIVHQVGHDDENVLVIEAKKASNPVPDEPDLEKLRLPVGAEAGAGGAAIRWV